MSRSGPVGARAVRWRCACGVVYEGLLDDSVYGRVRSAWAVVHDGPGHRPLAEEEAGGPGPVELLYELLWGERPAGTFDGELVTRFVRTKTDPE